MATTLSGGSGESAATHRRTPTVRRSHPRSVSARQRPSAPVSARQRPSAAVGQTLAVCRPSRQQQTGCAGVTDPPSHQPTARPVSRGTKRRCYQTGCTCRARADAGCSGHDVRRRHSAEGGGASSHSAQAGAVTRASSAARDHGTMTATFWVAVRSALTSPISDRMRAERCQTIGG